MITEAFQHFPGVGPVRLSQLQAAGIRSWHDLMSAPERIPASLRPRLLAECQRSLQALENDDIPYLVEQFGPQDRWRILAHYLDRVSFFDIETTGLEYDATITVIVCWHRGRLHTFVEHENLDEFLELLDEVELLASFNGSTFDVPRVLDSFHIPSLPCPHLDVRWPCYHRGLRGGLKDIALRLGISRPNDLADANGELAVKLWFDWCGRQDRAARDLLVRYCAADVLLLVMLSHHLAGKEKPCDGEMWSHLPAADASGLQLSEFREPATVISRRFGNASPTKLRARRRRAG